MGDCQLLDNSYHLQSGIWTKIGFVLILGMNKTITFLLSLLTGSMLGQMQWTTCNIPNGGRYDDISFVNDSVGWVAGGNLHTIYHTVNGGANWTMQYNTGLYNRSIRFFDDSVGICGSFSSSTAQNGFILWKTTNAGTSWQNITPSLNASVKGICGLSIADDTTIYACGVWAKPAYIFKSSDRGNNWQYIDMSPYAQALIDMHFLNKDTGFAVGSAVADSLGGVVLYTTNGGANWQVKHQTNIYQDCLWKIQCLDKLRLYVSVEAQPSAGNTRILKSNDGGMNWSSVLVDPFYYDNQVVGFMDTLTGWAGGMNKLFKTTDGGQTWNQVVLGSAYNRFVKMNDSLAYLSGVKIYKYSPSVIGVKENPKHDDIHELGVRPNPSGGVFRVSISINTQTTFCELKILNSEGKTVRVLNESHLDKGKYNYEVNMTSEKKGGYFLVMHTHEGLIYRKLAIQ